MLRIQPGKFYQINNSDKKSSANDHYNMIVVEDNEGEIHNKVITQQELELKLF